MPELFEEMSTNLNCLDNILDSTLSPHGFVRNVQSSEGRYPRRRFFKGPRYFGTIDLTMDWDNSGHRYKKFWPEAPFTLWANTSINIEGISYRGKNKTLFSGKSFIELKDELQPYLEDAITFIASQSVTHVLRKGEVSKLGANHNKMRHFIIRNTLIAQSTMQSLLNR